MNRDEILKMEAGVLMDALVAERVMGWHNVHKTSFYNDTATHWQSSLGDAFLVGAKDDKMYEYRIPYYSTDIAAAWEVVEKLQSQNIKVTISTFGENWWIEIFDYTTEKVVRKAFGTTAPLAICRAVLLAVME
jgi:hypothetical protein